jgi:hypothetical protein
MAPAPLAGAVVVQALEALNTMQAVVFIMVILWATLFFFFKSFSSN